MSRARSKVGAAKVRQQLADTDRRLKVQVQALEDGIEPELVSARIQELRDHHGAFREQNGLRGAAFQC